MSQMDVLRARAESIAIEVTSKCNLRCSYCHKSDEVHEALPASNADLADETIDRLYEECKRAGIRNVMLSVGGETTSSPEWYRRVAQFLDDTEIEAHIVSNFARLFNEDDLTALAKFKAIQISFDSADLQMVRKLRSKADLRTITFNVVRLRQKAAELGRMPTLVVNCTLWRDNISGVTQLASFCRALGIDQLLLTEGFISTKHNYSVPETLDTLNDEDVEHLARQIIAAEDVLSGSSTGLRLQSHLLLRIGELLDEVHQGSKPQNAAFVFHRRLGGSACRQPWQSPLVTADGSVWSCCVAGSTAPIGNVAGGATLTDILDSDAARAVRASILQGKTRLPCNTCSFASELPLGDFIEDIREWQGETIASRREIQVQYQSWPGLFGNSEQQVIVENAGWSISQKAVALIESDNYGMHRVLVDAADCSAIVFRMRPRGRRRLRLDLAAQNDHSMIGRAHIAATRSPSAEVAMGDLDCGLTWLSDGWLEVAVQSAKPFSHFNMTLMREDSAVLYRGDGRSATEFSDLQTR